MQIRQMAIKITPDTYPVAVACLGAEFATLPVVDVEDAYLVINTPQSDAPYPTPYGRRGPRYSRYSRGHLGPAPITLGNTWMTEEDLRTQYSWDGRKNQTTFFEVTKVAEPPLPKHPADVDEDEMIRRLYASRFGDQEG